MEKITNRIYYQETRLPWRDKYLEELENKNEDRIIEDFDRGFSLYSIAIDTLKKDREKGKEDFYYTKGIFNIVIPKYMNESYYEIYKFGDETIEDFYNTGLIGLGRGKDYSTIDFSSNSGHDIYEIFVIYNHKSIILHKTYDLDNLPRSPYSLSSVDTHTGELREDILKIADEIIKDLKESPNPEGEKEFF